MRPPGAGTGTLSLAARPPADPPAVEEAGLGAFLLRLLGAAVAVTVELGGEERGGEGQGRSGGGEAVVVVVLVLLGAAVTAVLSVAPVPVSLLLPALLLSGLQQHVEGEGVLG